MDWVHCNTCFTLPSDSKSQFMLTSCGHLYCEKCVSKDKKCKTCGQTFSGLVQLSNQMKPDVQMYFMDVKDTCKNAIKQIQQVQQVAEFQKGHIQRLLMFRKQQLSKASDMMVQARELDRKYRIVCKENEIMKNFIASRGINIKELLPERNEQNYPMTPKTPSRHTTRTPNIKTPGTPSVMKPMQQPTNQYGMNSRMTSPSATSARSGQSPMKAGYSLSTRSSPSNTHYNTPNNQRNLKKTPLGPSPLNKTGNTMVTPGRLSIRTPPVNGRIGSISPMRSSSRSNSPFSATIQRTPLMKSPSSSQSNLRHVPMGSQQHHHQGGSINASTSKITQSLNTLKSGKSPHPYLPTSYAGEEKRPLSLMHSRGSGINRSGK